MNTSYFGNMKPLGLTMSIDGKPGAVSVARFSPRWWGKGKRMVILAPSADLIERARKGLPWDEYKREYERDVLNKLNPETIYAELKDSTIMCWEKSPEYCHRTLIARWIEKNLKLKVREL